MAVTKRKEAERAVVRAAVEAGPAIYSAYHSIQAALNDDRVNPGAEERLENEAEALAMLGHAIEALAKLSKRSIDAPDVAVRDDASDTSRLAARRITPTQGSKRRAIYDAVAMRRQGMTDLELEALLGWPHQTVSAARNSLVENGWLHDSGQRRAFNGSRDSIVWIAVGMDVF